MDLSALFGQPSQREQTAEQSSELSPVLVQLSADRVSTDAVAHDQHPNFVGHRAEIPATSGQQQNRIPPQPVKKLGPSKGYTSRLHILRPACSASKEPGSRVIAL